MKCTLYRNMSLAEASEVLRTGLFTKPTNKIYLPRKWFSTSLFRSHYFKSPFYSGDTTILKVLVNEDFFARIFTDGTFIPKEPNGFYGYDVKDEILYAKAHKTIDDLYNVGFLCLEKLNGAISDISEIKDEDYCSYLEQGLLGKELGSLPRNDVKDSLEFFFQVSYDIAVLILKYQTLMLEAINPVIKSLHFAKDMKELKRKNLDKYSVTLRIRFKPGIRNLSLFHEEFISLDYDEILKVLPYIESIDMASLQPPRELKEYLHVVGDNEYTKHNKKELKQQERLTFLEFQKVTELLFLPKVSEEELIKYLPFLADMKDINQVDPRHIDNVFTHTCKALNFSNLVINYFKDQGVTLDATTLVYVKWLLLLHDVGKPYCECNNITTRYSQFGEKDKYTKKIMSEVIDPDVYFDIYMIYRFFTLSSKVQKKKISRLIKEVIKEVMEYYKVTKEEADVIINKYLKVAMIAKVAHTASLKPRAYCSGYVDDMMFFDRVNEVLIDMSNNGFIFPYEDYYVNVDNSYDVIIESYYKKDNKCNVLDMVRSILKFDFNDLLMSYQNKGWNDEIQMDPDSLITTYFGEDNEFFDKYFKEELVSNKTHGDMHSARVLVFNYLMGRMTGLSNEDMEILALSSIYHDKGRNDGEMKHGEAGVLNLRGSNIIDSKIENYVYYLIEAHGRPDKEAEQILSKYDINRERALTLLAIFKDADGLDRVRLDKMDSHESALDVRYLRTDIAKRLIKFASMLNARFKMNALDVNPSVKTLLKV